MSAKLNRDMFSRICRTDGGGSYRILFPQLNSRISGLGAPERSQPPPAARQHHPAKYRYYDKASAGFRVMSTDPIFLHRTSRLL